LGAFWRVDETRRPARRPFHLADRPGQVVGREALLAQVWPGVVVGDDSLTQVVIKLRKALGDDPDRPTYIQTVTKKGYRLVAPVLSPAQSASVPLARPGRRARWLAGAVTASLLVAAGLWWSVEQHAMRLASSVELVADAETPTLAIAPFAPLGRDDQELLLARGITADLRLPGDRRRTGADHRARTAGIGPRVRPRQLSPQEAQSPPRPRAGLQAERLADVLFLEVGMLGDDLRRRHAVCDEVHHMGHRDPQAAQRRAPGEDVRIVSHAIEHVRTAS